MTLKIKTGVIKFQADRLFDNPYRPGEQQQNLVCTMDDGTEEKIYFQAYRKPHAVLMKGDRIQIIYDKDDNTGKVKRRLVAENSEEISQRPIRPAQKAPAYNQADKQGFYQQKYGGKQSADMFITERLAIYNLVLERVKNCNFALELSDSDKSDIATSILIEGTRNKVDFRELLVTQDHIVPENEPLKEITLEDYPLGKSEPQKVPLVQQSFEVQLDEIPF